MAGTTVLDDVEALTRRAMDAIAAYVSGHPQAADSEAGIAEWWLPAMGLDLPPAVARDAIARLVEAGVLERAVLADGSAIYRRAARWREG